MKKTYRNGDYTIGRSPNNNLWIIAKLGKPVATFDVAWIQRREGRRAFNPLWLLKGFLAWYHMI